MDRFIIRRPRPELEPEPVDEETQCEVSDTAIESVAAFPCASTGSRPTLDVDEDEPADEASCFVTSFVPMAMSPHLKLPVFLTDRKEVDGKTFIKMIKVDWKIGRMLIGGFVKNTRPLAKTDVIERLTKLRDDNFALALGGAGVDMNNAPQHDDLGIDISTEHRPAVKRRRRALLPQTTVVSAPSVVGVEGIDMCVALDGPGKPLWMEFSGENLNYVSSVCRAQLRVGDIKRVPFHSQCEGEEHGVYWLESRLQWRVNWIGGDGKRHCESVKLGDGATRDDCHFEVSKAEAKATAKELLQSRVSACV
jgi:hypothetical protein